MRDRPQIYVYSEKTEEVPFEPPCGIAPLVRFKDGICPFSGCKTCNECVSNEFDAYCIAELCHSDSYGLA